MPSGGCALAVRERRVLIDMHAHFIPGEFPLVGERAAGVRWPRMLPTESGARVFSTNAEGTGYTAQPVWWDVEARRAAMQTNGVDAELLSPFPGVLGYGYAAEDALDLARHVNASIASVCQADPRRFFGLGMAPMQDVPRATEYLREIKDGGLLGVEIASNINGLSLGHEQLHQFFAEAERLGLAIFVHGLAPTFAERIPPSARGGFGVAAEIALAAVSLAAGGVLDRFPSLRIALSHGAGGYPLMLTRQQFFWGGAWNEAAPTKETEGLSPAAVARRFWYDSLVFDRRALRYLADMLGADRLMIGTDHPAMVREQPVGRTLRDTTGLSQAELEQIEWTNCFRWLGIEP